MWLQRGSQIGLGVRRHHGTRRCPWADIGRGWRTSCYQLEAETWPGLRAISVVTGNGIHDSRGGRYVYINYACSETGNICRITALLIETKER